jgi:hypothetical protein
MAETTTSTTTWTTISRKNAIKANINLALRRLTTASEDWITRCAEEIEAKHIDAIGFYGYVWTNEEQKRVIQLLVSVDWVQHEKFVLELGSDVKIKNMGGLSNGALPETQAAIEIFDDTVKDMGINTHWFVNISSTLSGEARRICERKLGLSGHAPSWISENKNVTGTYSARELRELSSEITVAK